ncbi:nucleoside 2-deoxyribosyltransferase [Candidatus Poribacteria bacterium]|nr:nucleoside 2-deoxyribosyltransferase [Candidatus Poribacteria bacterium]
MRAYISIKYRADHSNGDCIEKIASALEQNGFETVCITRDIEKWGQIELSPQELMQRTFTEIDSSHLIVVDLTEKGVGLGIEAGYAYAKGIPIAVIAKKGSDISATLQGISQKLFLYDEFEDLTHFFKDIALFGD